MSIAPNRAVAFLTPLVFAPVAGAVSVWAAEHAGVDLDATSLQAIFIAGAGIAFAKAGLWLKGWQDWEKPGVTSADPLGTETADPTPDPDEPEEGFDGEGDPDAFLEEEPVPAGV